MRKTCGCGRSFYRAEWRALPSVGRVRFTEDTPLLELRNCPCGTTLAINVLAKTGHKNSTGGAFGRNEFHEDEVRPLAHVAPVRRRAAASR